MSGSSSHVVSRAPLSYTMRSRRSTVVGFAVGSSATIMLARRRHVSHTALQMAVFVWRGRCRGRDVHYDGQAGALPCRHAYIHPDAVAADVRDQAPTDPAAGARGTDLLK